MTAFRARRTFHPVDIALFSAATWNPHRIHLDEQSARADGLPGIVVQSHFVPAALLAALDGDRDARGRLGIGDRPLRAISWRNRRPVLAGETVLYEASAEDDEPGSVTWRALVDGEVATDGRLGFDPGEPGGS